MFILPSVLFSGLAIQFLSVTSFEFVVTSDPDSFSRCFVDNFTAGEDPYILPSMLFIRCYIPYSGKAMLDVVHATEPIARPLRAVLQHSVE